MATTIEIATTAPLAEKPSETLAEKPPSETVAEKTAAEKPPHHDKVYVDRGFAVARRHGQLQALDWPNGFLDLVAKLLFDGLVLAGRSLNEDLSRSLGKGLLQALVSPVHIPLNKVGQILATNPNNIWAAEGQFWVILMPNGEGGCKAKRTTNPGGSLRQLAAEFGVDSTTGEKRAYIVEEGSLYGDMKLGEWLSCHNGLEGQRPLLEAAFGPLEELECVDLRAPSKTSPKKEKKEGRDASPSRVVGEKKKEKKDKKKEKGRVGKEEMKEMKKKLKSMKKEAVEAMSNVGAAKKLVREAEAEYDRKGKPYQELKLRYLQAKVEALPH